MDEDNDGRFPDDSLVEVRYPRNLQEELGDRSGWPWLPGSILSQCGPDEWHVCVEDRALATLDDGSPAPACTADEELSFSCGEHDPSSVAYGTDPRLRDATQGDQPRSLSAAATRAVADAGAATSVR